jgi:RNA polymerase sigma-70 factor (ECF subfamily)
MAQERSAREDAASGAGLHGGALKRYFSKRVPAMEVDDLVQEVLLSLHSRRKNEQIENIQGYLFTVAAHVLAKRHRLQARAATPQAIDPPFDPLSPERILIGQEGLAAALEVIRSLPPRTRQIFVLHRFEEMTYTRIAAHLGISVSAIEKHIMLALRALNEGMRPL